MPWRPATRPRAYVQALRMEQAKQILERTEMSVEAIASMLDTTGFRLSGNSLDANADTPGDCRRRVPHPGVFPSSRAHTNDSRPEDRRAGNPAR